MTAVGTRRSNAAVIRGRCDLPIALRFSGIAAAYLICGLTIVIAQPSRTDKVFNPLKAKLAGDGPALGYTVGIPAGPVAQLLARAGPDWLWIDTEHSPVDRSALQTLIMATQGTDVAPLVRVATVDPVLTKLALDAGAYGIIFPMVNTAEQARLAVAATRYPPQGIRGVGPSLAAARWGLPVLEYIQRANEEIVTVVQIEHVDAVRNLDAILAVEGIDVAFVAPFDLSAGLGVPGQINHPDVAQAIAEAENKILASGVVLGGLAFQPEVARAMISRGYRFIMLGSDGLLLSRSASQMLEQVRK